MWNRASITNARGLNKKVDERGGQGGPAFCLRICGGCESRRGAQISRDCTVGQISLTAQQYMIRI